MEIKELHEYTTEGLVSIIGHALTDEQRTLVVQELHRRQMVVQEALRAQGLNKETYQRERIRMALAGEYADQVRSVLEENRALFQRSKIEAIPFVEIPEGLGPRETVKEFRRRLQQQAKELYRQYRAAEPPEVKRERYLRRYPHRAEYRRATKAAKRKEEAAIRKAQREAYYTAMTPVRGWRVLYTDTVRSGKCEGVVRRISFKKAISSWALEIEGQNGDRVGRAITAVEPLHDPNTWAKLLAPFKEYEQCMRHAKALDFYTLKAQEATARVEELRPLVEAFHESGFFDAWAQREAKAREEAGYAPNKTE